ncbi:aldehyde dehydrogenase family protein [Marivibrio halodurans]|uniref:Aldehyde dehydrogenase family protein n=1 Tax=Marivibrio halodurans TaxID=2039722 RepID=A0A8J7SMK1_9PROT|nr:aldehyde dehydrogenase family protein [Marivibrio halodurans]MBP5857448.1 aldehyde dehydrogenase family protein [Marivibrio halodurans]
MPESAERADATRLPNLKTEQFVAGIWREGSGPERQIKAPYDGSLLATIKDAGRQELGDAVKAGRDAHRAWWRAGPGARGATLRQAANRLRENADELALIDALDCGNPLKGMKFDVALGATLIDYFAGVAAEAKGETIPQRDGKITYVRRDPVGVVARLVAFNHPLMFAAAKMAAPLAAGNAVIVKPSDETPLSALRMAALIEDLFPKGLLSVLTGGAELGAAICGHEGISAVGLIGSVNTGKAVLRGGADTLKRTQLELGGKNALVICEDADVDAAIAGAVKGMNLGWTAGQSCGSTSRILVHESLHDRVVEGIAKAFSDIQLGDPTDENTEMGCLSTKAQYQKVTKYIEQALSEGAVLAAGGDPQGVPSDGFFVRPTLFSGVKPYMKIAREEVFGPVLSVLSWRDESEMLDVVNGLDVGLTASVWTEDLNTAMRLTDLIQAGYVWVNDSSDHYLGAPFGGVKNSGIGREECLEELLAYTEQKTVTIVPKQHDPNKQ